MITYGRCEVCDKGPLDKNGPHLIRQNAVDEDPVWRCVKHNQLEIHPFLKGIIDGDDRK